MNTKDIKIEEGDKEVIDGDLLKTIFFKQKQLMKKYKGICEDHYGKIFMKKVEISDEVWNGKTSNLHTRVGNMLIKEMIDSTIQELSEAIQTMKNWKPWKQTDMETDVEHFKEEMIDGLHFYIEALILAGVDADEVFELYFKKNKVNQFRQNSKY